MEEKTTKKRTSKKVETPKEEILLTEVFVEKTEDLDEIESVVDGCMPFPEPITTEILEEETFLTGIVARCSFLRIRSTPNLKSKELGQFAKGTKIKISESKSTKDFYSVIHGKEEGFCLKTFIDIV